MARNRYDWNRVIELVEEHVGQVSTFSELVRTINARMSLYINERGV